MKLLLGLSLSILWLRVVCSFSSLPSPGLIRMRTCRRAIDPKLLTDIATSGVVGFAVDPLVGYIYNGTHPERSLDDDEGFRATFLFGAVHSLSVAAKVYASLLILYLCTAEFHLQLPIVIDPNETAPKVAFTVWIALTIGTVKRAVFLQSVAGDTLGRVALYDRFFDLIIATVTFVAVLEQLSIDLGQGFQSIIGAGGIGALIFSLASKNLAEAIVGGFVVRAWDAFDVGDDVRFGDNTEGTVVKIGLVETEIIGYDNIVTLIPNSELSQRVSNLSRIKRSQVKQTLRFKYADLDKLPLVLDAIKDEIQKSCPKLVVDGSKPFYVVLSQYEADHVEAVVNCHFDIAPGCSECVDNRQQVLLSIARAIKAYDVQFALPSIYYETSGRQIEGFAGERVI